MPHMSLTLGHLVRDDGMTADGTRQALLLTLIDALMELETESTRWMY